jgi:hypothetical protein
MFKFGIAKIKKKNKNGKGSKNRTRKKVNQTRTKKQKTKNQESRTALTGRSPVRNLRVQDAFRPATGGR